MVVGHDGSLMSPLLTLWGMVTFFFFFFLTFFFFLYLEELEDDVELLDEDGGSPGDSRIPEAP